MNMEIESRYVVPDRLLFSKLLKLERLGPYTLRPHRSLKIVDHYLDTRGRALLRQGWACRLRSQNSHWGITLKGPKTLHGPVMARTELEVSLPERIENVARWPKGPLRKQVVELVGGLPMGRLLTIRQTRHCFLVFAGSRQVGELSLDIVRVSGSDMRHKSYMLECELLEGGKVADLERLDTFLVGGYGLIPEPRSKLQRALELIERGGSLEEITAPRPSPMSIEALCRRYDVELAQATYVADLADQLYEFLLPLHQLEESRRSLLRTAALLYNIGESSQHVRRHIIGRDILLRQPIEGLTEDEQRIVAAATYLHRKKVTPERIEEVLPTSLSPQLRREALTIAALLRFASAFDSAETQDTRIQDVRSLDGTTRIILAGPKADQVAERAQGRSGIWDMIFDTSLQWLAQGDSTDEQAEAGVPQKDIGLHSSDTMREAARKVLGFHFERMLQHEQGTILGKDPEELHDVRVATRRMRSALRLFGAYVTGALVAECNDGLRRLARILGDVRDMDVAIEGAKTHLASLPSPREQNLDPLLRAWRARRRPARRRLLRYLRGQTYQDFLISFRALLDALATPYPSASEADTVGHVVPPFIYVDWRVVHAYDAVLDRAPIELLHALRIDCKRLRYIMEFFREVLPKKMVGIIDEVIDIQDHLGELHDAAVTIDMLDDFVAGSQDTAALEAVTVYREACQEQMSHLLGGFPKAWKRFSRASLRRRFEELLSL